MSLDSAKAALDNALDEYLKEFGDDGYDRVTFIDYVVTQVLGDRLKMPDADKIPPFAPGLIEFYRGRADWIQKSWKITDAELKLAQRRHRARGGKGRSKRKERGW